MTSLLPSLDYVMDLYFTDINVHRSKKSDYPKVCSLTSLYFKAG